MCKGTIRFFKRRVCEWKHRVPDQVRNFFPLISMLFVRSIEIKENYDLEWLNQLDRETESGIGERGLQSQWRWSLLGRVKILVKEDFSKFWLMRDDKGKPFKLVFEQPSD